MTKRRVGIAGWSAVLLALAGVAIPGMAQVTYSVFPAQGHSAPVPVAQPTNRLAQTTVTLAVRDSTVLGAITVLCRQLHLRPIYNDSPLLSQRRVTAHLVNVKASEAFATVLAGTGLAATMADDGETVVIGASGGSVKREGQLAVGVIAGRVTDSASGAGLGGAQVRVAGAKNLATVTSDSGNFLLRDVPAGDQVLMVRLFGYKPVERTVTVVDGQRTTIRMTMAAVPTVLSGVVTTATGIQKRIEVGNDITVLNADSIMRVAPVQTVTDMLATRVPGLIVQNTSGVPGAPSRLRLRGSSSVLLSDDPIVVVDGVRVYADQSGSMAGPGAGGGNLSSGGGSNVAGLNNQGGASNNAYAGPSALDQIDPNSIETIEVMKGPSATAIYGSDAANGVIIVTTKHGHAGPTHWSLSLNTGRTTLPGSWTNNYFRFGHDITAGQVNSGGGTTSSAVCVGGVAVNPATCTLDSLIVYQALNDPRLSPLGTGWGHNASLTVSGGSGSLTYSITGSASNQTGYLHLPDAVAQLFDSTHGFSAPHWMTHPDAYTTYGGQSALTAQLGRSGASITLASQLFQSAQQQSALQNVLNGLSQQYFGTGVVAASALSNNFSNIYQRAELNSLTFTNGLTLNNWAPWRWLPLHATAGVSVRNTDNNTLLPRDYVLSGTDSLGSYTISRGSAVTKTLTVGTNLLSGQLVSAAVGINVNAASQTTFNAATTGLPIGVSVPTSFVYANGGPTQSQYNTSTYGWYVAPTLNLHSRLFVSPGFRLDGGSASGSNSQLNLFPKMDVSWVAVNRPASDPLFGVLTLLRPRIAFGIAGVQPGPTERLRLLLPGEINPIVASGTPTPITVLHIYNFGNTQIHPERSREVEGGADLQLWNNRLSLQLTAYHKMRYDAIEQVPVAPSVAGYGSNANSNYYANIGTIRNTGVEATVSAQLVDTRMMQWSVNGNVSHDNNMMVNSSYGGGAIRSAYNGFTTEIVPGYPLNGIWARPILGYEDSNTDGVIEKNEVRLGDSLVYVGSPLPNYEMTLSTTLSFLNNRLSVTTSVDYQNGLTQVNGNSYSGISSSGLIRTPSVTPGQEAAIAAYPATSIGLDQTVNTLRWQTLSVSYLVPPSISRRFRVPALSLALQGSNLALHTNYRGKDPDVNAFASGNLTQDTGQLPQPRLWSLNVRIGN